MQNISNIVHNAPQYTKYSTLYIHNTVHTADYASQYSTLGSHNDLSQTLSPLGKTGKINIMTSGQARVFQQTTCTLATARTYSHPNSLIFYTVQSLAHSCHSFRVPTKKALQGGP